jgi:hypothetical protein
MSKLLVGFIVVLCIMIAMSVINLAQNLSNLFAPGLKTEGYSANYMNSISDRNAATSDSEGNPLLSYKPLESVTKGVFGIPPRTLNSKSKYETDYGRGPMV